MADNNIEKEEEIKEDNDNESAQAVDKDEEKIDIPQYDNPFKKLVTVDKRLKPVKERGVRTLKADPNDKKCKKALRKLLSAIYLKDEKDWLKEKQKEFNYFLEEKTTLVFEELERNALMGKLTVSEVSGIVDKFVVDRNVLLDEVKQESEDGEEASESLFRVTQIDWGTDPKVLKAKTELENNYFEKEVNPGLTSGEKFQQAVRSVVKRAVSKEAEKGLKQKIKTVFKREEKVDDDKNALKKANKKQAERIYKAIKKKIAAIDKPEGSETKCIAIIRDELKKEGLSDDIPRGKLKVIKEQALRAAQQLYLREQAINKSLYVNMVKGHKATPFKAEEKEEFCQKNTGMNLATLDKTKASKGSFLNFAPPGPLCSFDEKGDSVRVNLQTQEDAKRVAVRLIAHYGKGARLVISGGDRWQQAALREELLKLGAEVRFDVENAGKNVVKKSQRREDALKQTEVDINKHIASKKKGGQKEVLTQDEKVVLTYLMVKMKAELVPKKQTEALKKELAKDSSLSAGKTTKDKKIKDALKKTHLVNKKYVKKYKALKQDMYDNLSDDQRIILEAAQNKMARGDKPAPKINYIKVFKVEDPTSERGLVTKVKGLVGKKEMLSKEEVVWDNGDGDPDYKDLVTWMHDNIKDVRKDIQGPVIKAPLKQEDDELLNEAEDENNAINNGPN